MFRIGDKVTLVNNEKTVNEGSVGEVIGTKSLLLEIKWKSNRYGSFHSGITYQNTKSIIKLDLKYYIKQANKKEVR